MSARDPRVRLPRQEPTIVDPDEVETILAHPPPRWRLALRTLAETGIASVKIAEGVLLDVYSHVLINDGLGSGAPLAGRGASGFIAELESPPSSR